MFESLFNLLLFRYFVPLNLFTVMFTLFTMSSVYFTYFIDFRLPTFFFFSWVIFPVHSFDRTVNYISYSIMILFNLIHAIEEHYFCTIVYLIITQRTKMYRIIYFRSLQISVCTYYAHSNISKNLEISIGIWGQNKRNDSINFPKSSTIHSL